jgi:hypothetical protein
MFKKILLAAMLGMVALFVGQTAKADDYVQGYYRSNGTYVAPYYRTTRDTNFYNNYSTKPNINPYTGVTGTRLVPQYSPRYKSPSSSFPSTSRSTGKYK